MTEPGAVLHTYKVGSGGLFAPCEGEGCQFCVYDARTGPEPVDDWWPRVQIAYKALTEQAACWQEEFADGNPGHVLSAMDAAVVTVRLLDEAAHQPVCGCPAGARAVPPFAPTTLRSVGDGQGVSAVVADLPQLDGGEAGLIDGAVSVAPVGGRVIGEVAKFEDGDPAAGAGVASEGHVTNGGTKRHDGQCHEHGIYMGDDNWDADCCMCCGNPCSGITALEAVAHGQRQMERHAAAHRRAIAYVLEHGHEEPSPS